MAIDIALLDYPFVGHEIERRILDILPSNKESASRYENLKRFFDLILEETRNRIKEGA